MSRNVFVMIVICMILATFFFIFEKNEIKLSVFQKKNSTTVNACEEIKRQSPESLITQYYSMETTRGESFLNQFFYNHNNNISAMKLKIKCFNVKKISIDKIISIKQKDNIAVMSCAYNTYFDGIDSPRQDIEVIKLYKKENGWYIINDLKDINSLNDSDVKWEEEVEYEEKIGIWNNDETKNILNFQNEFDEKNDAFMKSGANKFNEELKK